MLLSFCLALLPGKPDATQRYKQINSCKTWQKPSESLHGKQSRGAEYDVITSYLNVNLKASALNT